MDQDLYIQLIYKQIAGDLSPEERRALEKWLGQSQANRQTAEDVQMIWNLSEKEVPKDALDLNTDFAKLQERIHPTGDDKAGKTIKMVQNRAHERKSIESQTKTEGVGKSWIKVFLAAASLLLLTGLGLAAWQYLQPDSATQIVVESQSEQKIIRLPDNTVVTLNANSKLEYPSTFTGNQRVVEFEGEAYFDVHSNPQSPFRILASNSTIVEVLGTEFNLQALKNASNSKVFVTEGKVSISSSKYSEKAIVLVGQEGQISAPNGKITVDQLKAPDRIYWLKQELIFADTPFKKVEETLENIFDVSIETQNKDIENCGISASFKQAELRNILATLSQILSLQIQENPTGISIRGGNCN